MKYGRTIITLAALSLAACSSDKTPTTAESTKSLDVVGTYKSWGSQPALKQYLTIDKSSVTMTSICKGYSKVVRVEVTAPARVTESSIEILADVEKRDKDSNCLAKLEKGVVAYEMNQYKDLLLASTTATLPTRFEKLGVEKVSTFGRVKNSVMGFVGSAASFGKEAMINVGEQQGSAIEAQGAAGLETGKAIVNGVKAIDQSMRDSTGQLATKFNEQTSRAQAEEAAMVKNGAIKVIEAAGKNPAVLP